ncbi:MAG: hypothetical protein JNK72_16975 [Myxococcales bacterium]|nr:hypothetical protein [Myxococcales bacterium]
MSAHDDEREVFPAGAAVLFLVLGFTLTRLFVGLAVDHPRVADAGAFFAVAGVLLGWVALSRAVITETRSSLPGIAWIVLRLAVASPVLALCVAAMWGDVTSALQLVALPMAALTVLLACGRGFALALAHRQWLSSATLLVLAIGQTSEFVAFPLRFLARPGSGLAHLATTLGVTGELSAFVCALFAVIAAARATLREVGGPRTLTFAALPTAIAMALLTLPAQRPRTTESLMKFGFRVRFDLLGGAVVAHPSRGALALYTLAFSWLLGASMLSLAAQYADRGAALRRCLGWVCVLLAGFGGPAAAGLLDPIRVTALCLGAVLLEGAAARERDVPRAPALDDAAEPELPV